MHNERGGDLKSAVRKVGKLLDSPTEKKRVEYPLDATEKGGWKEGLGSRDNPSGKNRNQGTKVAGANIYGRKWRLKVRGWGGEEAFTRFKKQQTGRGWCEFAWPSNVEYDVGLITAGGLLNHGSGE